ncbi:MAG: hypothetical protein FWD71_13330 [Oscillospiraceae bacterium]|nr:hypothetical protein [Oscillospiraceae bacterium]
MRDFKNNKNKYGVQNNRNVTHQIILNIDNMSGNINPPKNETEGRSNSRVRKDNLKQDQGHQTPRQNAKGEQSGNAPLSISVSLYATGLNRKIFTNHFYRSKNHNFGVEVQIYNSTSFVHRFNIGGCVYDSNGVEICRWERTTKEVPPSNSLVENDFWVDRSKFLAMKDGKYKVQLWINDIKVEKVFFTVSQ